jgi:hypothetical protein
MITDRYMRPSLAPTGDGPADDILRARIQTLGVAEHVFEMSLGRKSVNWRLYDVGFVSPLASPCLPLPPLPPSASPVPSLPLRRSHFLPQAGLSGLSAGGKSVVEARHHSICRHLGRMYPEIRSKSGPTPCLARSPHWTNPVLGLSARPLEFFG